MPSFSTPPSASPAHAKKPLHVAIIMDGNGRWAKARHLPRTAGHRAGVRALQRIIEAATAKGIGVLTVYAFSSDNWSRPAEEVAALMGLMRRYLVHEIAELVEHGVRLDVIGRRDRLPEGIAELIARAEQDTAAGTRLHLRLAIDYSGRDAIVAAAAACGDNLTREALSARLSGDCGDIDLLIRTSGEQRLSDFLLWEAAYAELHFSQRLWPDFDAQDLAAALADFAARDRRFGGLVTQPAASAANAANAANATAAANVAPQMKERCGALLTKERNATAPCAKDRVSARLATHRARLATLTA